MNRPTTKWRCTNEKCGRVWSSEFDRCQKCGAKTEMVREDGSAVNDLKPQTACAVYHGHPNCPGPMCPHCAP